MEKVRVRQRVNEVCEVCIVERRGLESDAGRGACDLHSLCGSGVYLFVRLPLFIPNWFGGGSWGRQGNWHPSCGICPTVISERRRQHSLRQGWAIKDGHLLLGERGNTSARLLKSPHPPPAPSWHGTCWAGSPSRGQGGERKDLFLRSRLSHVAALVSTSKPVSWEMMHSVRRLNVQFPPPLSVKWESE